MAEGQCVAKTASGKQCKLRASASGFCRVHDPALIEKRKAEGEARRQAHKEVWEKGEMLRSVMQEIQRIGRAKGGFVSIDHTDLEDWRYATLDVSDDPLLHITDPNKIYLTLDGTKLKISGAWEPLLRSPWYKDFYEDVIWRLEQFNGLTVADSGRISSQKTMERAKVVSQSSRSAPQNSEFDTIKRLLQRFPLVVRQLSHRRHNRPAFEVSDEYDVQDLLHALLRANFDDIRDEEYTPSYAGNASRVDFLLKVQQTFIEVKMTSTKLKHKEIRDQLIVDIDQYKKHPDCKALICFVFDPDHHIKNPTGFENDLSGIRNGLDVHVLVVPH